MGRNMIWVGLGLVLATIVLVLFQRVSGSNSRPKDRSVNHMEEGLKLLSIPLFAGAETPNFAKVLEFANQLDRARPMSIRKSNDSDGFSAEFFLGEVRVLVQFIDVPVPGDEVERSAKRSRLWKEADSTSHQSQAIVVGLSDRNVEDLILATSRINAGLLKQNKGIGLYVGNAEMVVSADVASDLPMSSKGDWLPLIYLWIDFPVSKDESGTHSASTLGMEHFQHLEFEIVESRLPPKELREHLFDLCAYVLERGRILKHGQTFGRTDLERWPIEIGSSRLGKAGEVIRVGIP